MSFGLSPVSTSLKSIAPYLQRAEELVDREPIIAYWCGYYAAQLGISLKAQDTNSRNLLLNVLGALEQLKKDIGPNDAIDLEPASAAYVENFAFKVFKMADDEDRTGNASKSTAKKFLAAANFFEVLRIFPKADVSELTEGKLKYAKWKAADIAKAFREGKRPTPGPAGSQLDPELTSSPPPLPLSDEFESQPQPPSPPRLTRREPSPPTKLSRSPKRQSPPPSMSRADIARANQLPLLPGEGGEALSPGRWSTTATPGLDLARTPGLNGEGSAGGSADSLNNWHEHVVDPMSRAAAQSSSNIRTAWVSTEMEGALSDEEPLEDPVLNGAKVRGRVRFSPPGADTIPIEASPPRLAAQMPPSGPEEHSSPLFRVSELPPGFVPTGPPANVPEAGPGIYVSSSPKVPPFLVPPPPPPVPHLPPTYGAPPSPPSAPIRIVPSAPPISTITPPPTVEPIRVTARPPPRPVELTPSIIAKAQRHCRFAISALDYEDATHAIKELKDALRLLEGGMGES